MTKDEILKKMESILNDNAERIAELEKENARLKEINAHTLSQLNLDNGELIIENEKLKKENSELQHKVDTLQGFLDRDVEFDNLQKENTELKERNRGLDAMLTGQSLLSNGLEEQLTKAKELLKKFMPYVIESYLKQDISNIKLSFSEIEEAEQFLKEK